MAYLVAIFSIFGIAVYLNTYWIAHEGWKTTLTEGNCQIINKQVFETNSWFTCQIELYLPEYKSQLWYEVCSKSSRKEARDYLNDMFTKGSFVSCHYDKKDGQIEALHEDMEEMYYANYSYWYWAIFFFLVSVAIFIKWVHWENSLSYHDGPNCFSPIEECFMNWLRKRGYFKKSL